MSTFIQTSVIGGCDGTYFNDLQQLTGKDGQLTLDITHPITRIEISSGWLVNGLKVSYKLRHPGLRDVTLTHGCFDSLSNNTGIELKDSEIILAIYGRAGYQDYYLQRLINSMTFVIFDQKSASSRIVGPVGNVAESLNQNNGSTYHVSNILAFAGYDNGGKPEGFNHGIVGLSFYMNVSSNLNSTYFRSLSNDSIGSSPILDSSHTFSKILKQDVNNLVAAPKDE